MSYQEAVVGADRLEEIGAQFDYAKAPLYIALIKQYLQNAKQYRLSQGRALTVPFFDVLEGADIVISPDLTNRLESWLSAQKHFSTTAKEVCRWYVRALGQEGAPGAIVKSCV